jgi:hypothetical protein
MLADVPYFDGIGPPFFKTPPNISFSSMIPNIYPVSTMGRKWEKSRLSHMVKLKLEMQVRMEALQSQVTT